MKNYVLVRGKEIVEVMPGREARRDQLIAAGYTWANRPTPDPEPDPAPAPEEFAENPKRGRGKQPRGGKPDIELER